jgi:phosphate transport system substrate-binding protein
MTDKDRTYFWKTSLKVWLVLPILVQVAAISGYMVYAIASRIIFNLNAPHWLGVSLALALMGGLVFGTGSIALWRVKRINVPEHFWPRYGPILLPLVLMWIVWIVDMHLRGGDFSQQGEDYLWFIFLPYFALVFAILLTGWNWLILILPSVAIVGYLFFTWRLSQNQLMLGARSMQWTALVLLAMLGVIGWQAYQRQSGVINWLDLGEVFQENLQLHDYRPFKPNNRLVKPASPPALQFDSKDAPRLDGATAAYPVYAALAQAMYPADLISEKITNNKTLGAYERLIKGDTDAIFVAQASPEHARLAKEQGVDLIMTPVAREAFVFLVHKDNPVKQLSLHQIRAIYAGQITNWKEAGGSDERIVAFQRPKNSGSQTVMEVKVMQGAVMKQPLQEEVQRSMGGLIRQVASYRNHKTALGYSFRFYVTSMQNPKNLDLLSIDGIAPTVDNIRSGSYPLSVDVYMVTTQKSNASTTRLRDWILSPADQQLISDAGYVPR